MKRSDARKRDEEREHRTRFTEMTDAQEGEISPHSMEQLEHGTETSPDRPNRDRTT